MYLFMWEERYLLDQEVSRWTTNFVQKFGEDSLFVYNNENWDEMSASQSIFGGWLFSTKKLTIIQWIPLDNAKWNTFRVSDIEWFIENFIKKEWKIPEDNLLVFISNKPDKRSRFFKFLKSNAQIKEFNKLRDFEIKWFVRQQLWDIKITDWAYGLFVDKVWNNLYRLQSELEKLRLYCLSKSIDQIDENMVNDVVFWLVETEAFEFLKILFKDKWSALSYLQRMQDQWFNWNAFSGPLYWWLKLYIILYQFWKKWITDVKTIASQTGINPYSLKQNIWYMDVIMKNWIEIENMYKKLIKVDVDIKSWKKIEESFWLETKKTIVKFKI